MEYGRDGKVIPFKQPKEPSTPEDLHARGFSRRHRHLADGRTVIVKYSDSMRTPRDSRYQQATIPTITEMYEYVQGKRGAPDSFRKLPTSEFNSARREIESRHLTTHLSAEDTSQQATGREVVRTIRRSSRS